MGPKALKRNRLQSKETSAATGRRGRYRAQSQFSRSAKVDDSALIQLAYAFCHGLSLERAVALSGVTAKTARAHYLAFRARLPKSKFVRWHASNQLLPSVSDPEQQVLIKTAFHDVLAQCYFNAKCYENFRYGARQDRLCRICPLSGRFTASEQVDAALSLLDTIRAFYRVSGIRREPRAEPLSLFRLHLIHTVTVMTVRDNSKTKEDGLLDPLDKTFLSLGTLLDMLLEDLAEDPL